MEYSIDVGFVNAICLCKLSLYLIDLSMLFVIHNEFLCLYLLNMTNLCGICLTFAFSSTSMSML